MSKSRRRTGPRQVRHFEPIGPVVPQPGRLVRFLRWLIAPQYGQLRSTLPFAVAAVLALVATYGQALAYPHEDTTPEFRVGPGLILAMNALVGFAVALTFNPMPIAIDDSENRDESMGAASAALRIWPMFGLLIAVQVVVGIPLTIAYSIGEWTWIFSPLVFGGVLPLIMMLLAWLATMLVIWPLISLIGALWRVITRRAVNMLVVHGSIIFLTLSALAVTATLGTDYDHRGSGGTRGAGLVALVWLWLDQTGDPTTLAFRWVARAISVLFVIEIIAFTAASTRGYKIARAASKRVPSPVPRDGEEQ